MDVATLLRCRQHLLRHMEPIPVVLRYVPHYENQLVPTTLEGWRIYPNLGAFWVDPNIRTFQVLPLMWPDQYADPSFLLPYYAAEQGVVLIPDAINHLMTGPRMDPLTLTRYNVTYEFAPPEPYCSVHTAYLAKPFMYNEWRNYMDHYFPGLIQPGPSQMAHLEAMRHDERGIGDLRQQQTSRQRRSRARRLKQERRQRELEEQSHQERQDKQKERVEEDHQKGNEDGDREQKEQQCQELELQEQIAIEPQSSDCTPFWMPVRDEDHQERERRELMAKEINLEKRMEEKEFENSQMPIPSRKNQQEQELQQKVDKEREWERLLSQSSITRDRDQECEWRENQMLMHMVDEDDYHQDSGPWMRSEEEDGQDENQPRRVSGSAFGWTLRHMEEDW